jgi:uncharacterized protein YjbJ (UPF0337 family)
MKASTTTLTRGTGNVAVGKTKELAGKAVRSPTLRAKGTAQKVAGKIQRAVGKEQKARGC